MAHTSSRIFIDDSYTPPRGAEIADVQSVIKSAYTNIGKLITDGDINPFALYKPVCESNKRMVTRGILARMGFGDSSRSTSLPHAQTVNELVALYEDGDSNYLWGTVRANGWRYLKPRGSSQNEPFRLLDFVKCVSENNELHPVADIGYDHQAKNPFGTFGCALSVSRNGGAFTAMNERGAIPQSGVSEEWIVIGDFNTVMTVGYKMLYYGVMLVPESGQQNATTTYFIFNNDETIDDGNTQEIRGNEQLQLQQFALSSGMPLGYYTAYPFLSNIPLHNTLRSLTKLSSERNQYISSDHPWLYSLPGSTPLRVNIFETEIIITVNPVGIVDSSLGGSIYITIKNNSTSQANIPRLELQFRTSDAEFSDARRTGEVFYDGQYRYDDTGSHADNMYAYFLRPSGGYDVDGNGGERRIPESGQILLQFPSNQTAWVIIGDPTRNRVYGIADFIMPADPNAFLEP